MAMGAPIFSGARSGDGDGWIGRTMEASEHTLEVLN